MPAHPQDARPLVGGRRERTGIVDDGLRRAAVFGRFIQRRVDRTLSDRDLENMIAKAVDQRIAREVDAIVARRIARIKGEIDGVMGPQGPGVGEILTAVEAVTGCAIADLLGRRKSRTMSRPRQLGYWLVRRLRPDLSLPSIGLAFGGRDHSTVLFGARAFERYRYDPPVSDWLADARIIALINPEEKGDRA